MEPRIQSLLLDDNFTIDNQLPFPLGAFTQHHQPQQHHQHGSRPAPVEPSAPRPPNFSLHDIYSPATKDSHHHAAFTTRRLSARPRPPSSPSSTSLSHDQHAQHNQVTASSSRPPKSVPLAEVLNNEQTSSGFSGSVNELLLDNGAGGSPKKRRKVEGNDQIFTLPKPTLPVKKGNRRPRIPPLLQGLHQPPPNAGLFPPITGERVSRDREGGQPPPPPAASTTQPQPKPKCASIATPRVEKAAEKAVLSEPKASSPRHGAQEPEKAVSGGATATANITTSAKPQKSETGKRRKKWTEEETTSLLKGVAKFGIGSWKKILECPDFEFDGRTAVDLKDRFRTCCPDEYRKLKTPKAAAAEKDVGSAAADGAAVEPASGKSVSSLVTSNILLPGSSNGTTKKKRGPKVHRKDTRDLASIGIDTPFTKSTRRERREFTEQEDNALLRGFEKHGPHWHIIRNDPDLELTHRHPTDLRDRLRNRWPEKYAEAGYKIKLKDKNNKQDRQDGESADPSAHESPKESGLAEKVPAQEEHAMPAINGASHPSSNSAARPRAPDLKALLSNYPFPDPFTEDEFTSDIPFEGGPQPHQSFGYTQDSKAIKYSSAAAFHDQLTTCLALGTFDCWSIVLECRLQFASSLNVSSNGSTIIQDYGNSPKYKYSKWYRYWNSQSAWPC
ncbi:SANT domain DNA binding protein [Macrophomina phaseolina MS6]|uniref:SANT domain DNA binding protein n=1 Tax=Macrophomina phaseolina (strain MS6) TaxID=1126212 RepID=K2RAY4_MACPH|nr:SANT domain DNA binding protein [Macrophomina phaseolina MS6]